MGLVCCGIVVPFLLLGFFFCFFFAHSFARVVAAAENMKN